MLTQFNFSGQIVLVTGGTKGIGLQVAKDFYSSGANVILTGTSLKSFSNVRKYFMEKERFIDFLEVDFINKKSTNFFLKSLDKYEKIDILINNAGINRINYIDDTILDDWEDLVSVNLKAPYLITRNVCKKMKLNKFGRIVNIGSIFGVISKPKRSIYSITKHGLHGLTIAAALELAPFGILVNTVSPGFVMTELTKSILSKKEMEELAHQVPLKRFADPGEISSTILFLSSRDNSFITGQNIIIDGGFLNV